MTLRTKPRDHGTPNCQFTIFYHVWWPCMNRNSSNLHSIESPVTYDFPPHLRTRYHPKLHDFGSVLGWPLGTSFGLSQSHGRDSLGLCVWEGGPKSWQILIAKLCVSLAALWNLTQCEVSYSLGSFCITKPVLFHSMSSGPTNLQVFVCLACSFPNPMPLYTCRSFFLL
jgi:hypothetical protein